MLNFYVVSAGRDMVNDTDRPITFRSKSRAPPLQRKIQKMKVLSKTWVSLNNRLNYWDQKVKTFTFGIREQNKGTTKLQRQPEGSWWLWWVSSSSEPFRLPEWWEEHTTSGQGSFSERSPVGPRFSESLFLLDVPGTATEQVRTCGFRRNSSSSDKAPKIRDSVCLNSFERFLVTLLSISSETWEMYSCAIPGSSVFCDCLFFVFSNVSLQTAANCLLFLKVAMILREKFCQLWRQNWSFIIITKCRSPLFWGKKASTNANS